MAYPGMIGMPGQQANAGLTDQEAATVKMLQNGMESCAVKAVMSGGAGFALGGAFGLFMSSMSYDSSLTPQSQALAALPLKEQVKRGLKDMGSRSLSSAKNFGKIGLLYSGIECGVESFRAKNDLQNSVYAGCLAGGILGYPAGPSAALLGCGGFAAFSLAIDSYMRSDWGVED